MPRGRVAWYSTELGHGFIIPEDGGPKAFVRRDDIKAGEEEPLRTTPGSPMKCLRALRAWRRRSFIRTLNSS